MSKETTAKTCPYLDTINRQSLDFDFEPTCSQTLTTGPNVYACLVCGKFFRGRGKQTPAYLHSVNEGHAVFLHLTHGTFHCLPENYEILDPSLDDIRHAFKPVYTERHISLLDKESTLGRDLYGRRYLPGFLGLNNLNKTDCINTTLQALAHVKPLRDFFLRCSSGQAFHMNFNITHTKTSQSSRKRKRDNGGIAHVVKSKKKLVDPNSFSHLAKCFGDMVCKMWSDKRFKSTVDPHMLIQAISVASNKRFRIGKQIEAGEFMAWLLHQLHIGVGGDNRKAGSSIIHSIFQGAVEITTRKRVSVEEDGDKDEDDRIGSDDDEAIIRKEEEKRLQKESLIKSIDESTVQSNFLQLTLDIPEKPLFKDDNGGLVIPQEPLVNILKKFDGVSFNDVTRGANGDHSMKRRYRLKTLPNYLILCLARFPKRNSFNSEKNPTIVPFPVKNLDLSRYIFQNGNKKVKVPTEDEVRSMSVSSS